MPSIENAGVTRITDPSNPSRCCPCANQEGCDCLGEASCLTFCRSRASTAALCGFDEFGTPSVPPKKFLVFKIATVDPFKVCSLPTADCAPVPCNSDVTITFTGDFNGFYYNATGTLTYVSPGGGGDSNYTITNISGCRGTNPGDCVDYSSGFAIVVGGVRRFTGDNFTLSTGVEFLVALDVFDVGGWEPIADGCVVAGPSDIHVTKDTWDFVGTYVVTPVPGGPSVCIESDEDNSFRASANGSCLAAGGTVGPIGSDFPQDAYGGGATTTLLNSQEKDTVGNGCLGGGPPSLDYEGEVKQTLSSEDSIQNAIARAVANLDYGSGGSCDDNSAFITPRGTGTGFAFRQAQVRGDASTQVGKTYKMTITLGARIVGSSGPFLPTGTVIEITYLATSTVTFTPWQDIDCDEGFETKPIHCSNELQPS